MKIVKYKTPVYRVHKKNNIWYNYYNKKVDKKYYTLLESLREPKKLGNIRACSGIYGIFYKDKCLYVGQSFNVARRVSEHKNNYKKAKRHIKSVKRVRKLKVEYKYYELARVYNLSELRFKLIAVIKNADQIALTYAEQFFIDLYKPKFNHAMARPTFKVRRKSNDRRNFAK